MIISQNTHAGQSRRSTKQVYNSELPMWCVLESRDSLDSYYVVSPVDEIPVATMEGWRVVEDNGVQATNMLWGTARELRNRLYNEVR